jgi:glycosyltransferase involved in cell wall biosynthesis
VAAVIDLSVVVPAFNEEREIEGLVVDVERELVGRYGVVELIVVDDCSTDGTSEILERMAETRRWLRVLHAARNAGHGPSVVAGLEHARGTWIFQMDSDRQFVVAELADLWRLRNDADLVLGVRAARRDPRHRLLLSAVVGRVVSLLAGRRLRDPNVPFRLFRREVWEELRPLIGPNTLAPSILLVVGAAVRALRIVDVPVTHLPRAQGESSLRHWRLVSFSLRGLRQLVAFRLALTRSPAVAPPAAEEPR